MAVFFPRPFPHGGVQNERVVHGLETDESTVDQRIEAKWVDDLVTTFETTRRSAHEVVSTRCGAVLAFVCAHMR